MKPQEKWKNSKAKVFGFGSAALDFRIGVAEMGKEYRDKLLAQRTEIFGGGSLANALVQVARLGGRPYYLGKLGADWIGSSIQEGLELEGVDCSMVLVDPSLCSPFNLAIYAGEKRRRVGGYLLPNSLAHLTQGEVLEMIEQIPIGSWVLVELGEIPLPLVEVFCLEAKKKKMRLVMDVDLNPLNQSLGSMASLERIFASATVIAPNQKALEEIYPQRSYVELAEALSRDYQASSVITAGEEGAFYCDPQGVVAHQSPFPCRVVDTVGAGDAFHGGLLYGLANGLSLSQAVELGARCGAMNTEAFGAREGMARAHELKNYL